VKGEGTDVADDIGGDEAAWRNLVARYAAPAPDGAVPWPDREDVPGEAAQAGHAALEPPGPASPGAASPGPVPGVVPAPPQIRIIRPASPLPPPGNEDDDHYVPPAPPPLPRLDPVAKGAWAALFGGPAYLMAAVMAGWPVPGWAAFTSVAAFVGGFATLVMRMGERPPHDSGPDDGAVV
jgi:hypothetical protein